MRTSVASAEMIKLAANAFLATRISFINEIANVSEAVGADVDEVAYGMGLDRRIGTSYLNAGHRLRRQLLPEGRVLPQAAGGQQRLPLPARERRDRGQRPPEAARRDEAPAAARQPARARRSRSSGSRSSRTRTTCARRRRSCSLRGCGPRGPTSAPGIRSSTGHPELDGVAVAPSLLDAVRDADAAVIVTEWAELKELASAEVRDAMRTPLIVDGRNFLDPEAAARRGVRVRGHRPGLKESSAWKRF